MPADYEYGRYSPYNDLSDLPEDLRPKLDPGPTMCLRCDESFESEDRKSIRICPPCRGINRKIHDALATCERVGGERLNIVEKERGQ